MAQDLLAPLLQTGVGSGITLAGFIINDHLTKRNDRRRMGADLARRRLDQQESFLCQLAAEVYAVNLATFEYLEASVHLAWAREANSTAEMIELARQSTMEKKSRLMEHLRLAQIAAEGHSVDWGPCLGEMVSVWSQNIRRLTSFGGNEKADALCKELLALIRERQMEILARLSELAGDTRPHQVLPPGKQDPAVKAFEEFNRKAEEDTHGYRWIHHR